MLASYQTSWIASEMLTFIIDKVSEKALRSAVILNYLFVSYIQLCIALYNASFAVAFFLFFLRMRDVAI